MQTFIALPRCQELNVGSGHRTYPCTAIATYSVALSRVAGLRYRCTQHMRWNQAEGTLASATPLRTSAMR